MDINGDGKDDILVLSQDKNGRAVTEVLSYGHILVPTCNNNR
jgi:hypothetical protein